LLSTDLGLRQHNEARAETNSSLKRYDAHGKEAPIRAEGSTDKGPSCLSVGGVVEGGKRLNASYEGQQLGPRHETATIDLCAPQNHSRRAVLSALDVKLATVKLARVMIFASAASGAWLLNGDTDGAD
jgi:hypothetical protein